MVGLIIWIVLLWFDDFGNNIYRVLNIYVLLVMILWWELWMICALIIFDPENSVLVDVGHNLGIVDMPYDSFVSEKALVLVHTLFDIRVCYSALVSTLLGTCVHIVEC